VGVERVGEGRVVGVDVARGLALLGMMAVHAFPTFDDDGTPSLAHALLGGRALATFVLLAGVGLTFATRGRLAGAGRRATWAGVAARAGCIAAIGLLLNLADPPVAVILPAYGLFFALAIPLLGLSRRALLAVALVLLLVAPPAVLAAHLLGLPSDEALTPLDVLTPWEVASTLLLTGTYPAVQYMALLCVGLAVGRLALGSARVAALMLAGGTAVALTAWAVSSALLLRWGGLEALREAGGYDLPPALAREVVLWDPEVTASWWWLAVRAPWTATPVTMLVGTGTALAVLGAALLVTHLPGATRLLAPLAAAGSMTLTLYSAHILWLATGILADEPLVLWVAMSGTALVAATWWRAVRGQGPLEGWVARTSARARARAARPGVPSAASARPDPQAG
jgi:uncharacterized membrane protein YeiB